MSRSLLVVGEGLTIWLSLIGTAVCLWAATWVQLFARAGNGRPHNVRCGILSSCQPPSTFRDCIAALLARSHVSNAIASTRTFTFKCVKVRVLYRNDGSRVLPASCWRSREPGTTVARPSAAAQDCTPTFDRDIGLVQHAIRYAA